MKITENTTIPLFAAIGTIPVIVAAIVWISAISFKADEAKAVNFRQDEIINNQSKVIQNIEKISIRIEEKLNYLTKEIK